MEASVADEQPTVSEAFRLYRDSVIIFRSQSRSTEEHHNQTATNLIKYFGRDIPISELTFPMVRDWKLDMDKRHLSPLTVRGYLIRLRVVLGYLHLQGYECLDPALIRLPERPDTVPEVTLPAEVAQLIDATSKLRNKTIISLLYSTGLRVSELCALNRMDVKEEFFTVIGKGGRSRLCFIDERTRKFLDEYLDRRANGHKVYWCNRGKPTKRIRTEYPGDNNPALFISDSGDRITSGTVREIFKHARRKSGLTMNVHPHTMRHSFATNLNKNGASLRAIQLMMGHRSIQTTEMYLHLFDGDLKEGYRKYHTI